MIWKNRYLIITLISGLLTAGALRADDATLLPNAIQYFMDANGKPLANGKVFMYTPSTTTPKTTWTSADKAVAQPQPFIPLGISGKPASPIYGDGNYRQKVVDQFNNTIWDFNTASTAGGGSGPVSPTVGDGNIVGTILPWGGLVAPPNYVFAYGQTVLRADYPLYVATVTLPASVLCTSGLNVLSGLSDTQNITIGSFVEASCLPPNTKITGIAANSVTLDKNATVSTAVTATFFFYGNGNGSTTINIPDLRGQTLIGRTNMGGTSTPLITATYFRIAPQGLGQSGGSQSTTITLDNLPPYTPAGSITNGAITSTFTGLSGQTGLTGAGGAQAYAGGGFGPSQIVGTVASSQASSTFAGTPQGGAGNGLSVIQPSVTMNYVIKVLPDVAATVASGVASLGGMTGVLNCGAGIICASNTISAVTVPAVVQNQVVVGAGTGIAGISNKTVCNTADNTGVFDATAALQACIAVGGQVEIKAGTYRLSSQLNLVSNLTLSIDPNAVLQQYTRAARVLYGAPGLTNVEVNGGILYGEGTYCGNVGQGVTAACPSGAWTGDGGISGHNDRAIQLDNCQNCRLIKVHTKNTGTMGIALFGGKNIFIDQPFVEGTNLYSTAITSQGNFQYGLGLFDDPTYGAIDNLIINGFNISGVAQGILAANNGTSSAGKSRQINGGIGHDITGQHLLYASVGDYVIDGMVCANLSNACVKNQITVTGADPYNFTATDISADTIGTNLFEITVFSPGVGQHNIHLSGIANNASRGLSIFGPVTNLKAQVQVQDITGESVYIAGDGTKDIDVSVTSVRSGLQCVLVAATNADRIRFNAPNCREANTSNTGLSAFTVASASANVEVTNPTIADSNGLIVNGLSNTIAGGIIRVYGSANISGASSTCVSATGLITAWPIWNSLSCSGGSYTGASNIVNPAIGNASVPFGDLFLGASKAINWNNSAVTITESGSGLYFQSASNGYLFDNAVLPVSNRTSSLGVPTRGWTKLCLDGSASGTGCLTPPAAASTYAWALPAVSGTLAISAGGTSIPTIAQGDLLYGSAANVLSTLSKDTNATRYLSNTGTSNNPAWAQIALATGISGFGTGVATALGVNVGSAGAFITFNGAGGTPSSLTLTNATGLPTTGLTGTLQAAQEPAHAGDVTNSAGSLTLTIGATKVTSAMLNADVFSTAHSWSGGQTFTAPNLGTPASGVATNLTGTAAGLTAGNVTTNANLTGAVTSVGNATSLGSFTSASLSTAITDETGNGSAVFGTSPILSTVDARGTWTTGTSWTLPAFTLGGTITGGSQNITGLGTIASTAHTITSASATALAVGPNGSTNPAFQVDGSVASSATGVKITSQTATDSYVLLSATSSNADANLTLNGKGAGAVFLGSVSTGNVDIGLTAALLNVRSAATFINAAVNMTALASDTATVDNTVCVSGAGRLLKGSGANGICLGTSGQQFKTAFAPMKAGLDELMLIPFQNYRYRKGFGDDGGSLQYGTTAQEVELAIPEIVRHGEHGEAINFDTGALWFVGLRAIQQLKVANDDLHAEVMALKKSMEKAR